MPYLLKRSVLNTCEITLIVCETFFSFTVMNYFNKYFLFMTRNSSLSFKVNVLIFFKNIIK